MRIGDVMIPNIVYDQQSGNHVPVSQLFYAGDIAPHLRYGTGASTIKRPSQWRGTFLQNRAFSATCLHGGIHRDIEMEAGRRI